MNTRHEIVMTLIHLTRAQALHLTNAPNPRKWVNVRSGLCPAP